MEIDQLPPSPDDTVGVFHLAARWGLGQGGMTREESESAPPEEPYPKVLNTLNSSGLFQKVSLDKKTVRYVGSPQHGNDVGAVQADAPAPAPTRRIVYYFEMTVKNSGEYGRTSIGFTGKDYNLRRQPGWDANSCGYHGDDGHIFCERGKGEPFGPTFTSGDTVGAGINYASQEFFFTKNGKLVGTLRKNIKGPLYPTIAVHSQNEEVSVNFEEKQFLFDIKAFESKERLKQREIMGKLPLPSNVSCWIIRSYLQHYGYQDTLNTFDRESEHTILSSPTIQENGTNDQGDAYALGYRKILRQHIRNGEIDSACDKLRKWYPQIMKTETSALCFLLYCQRFIEYIRAGCLLDAVVYARDKLTKFFTVNVDAFKDLLEESIALLAYEDPSKSCVGYLLHPAHREFVADAVNAVVLSTNPILKNTENCTQSCLEKLLRQLTTCCWQGRAMNENQGETFDLKSELHN